MEMAGLFAVVEFPEDKDTKKSMVAVILSEWLQTDEHGTVGVAWPNDYHKSYNGFETASDDWPKYVLKKVVKTFDSTKEANEYMKMLENYTDSESAERADQQKLERRKHPVNSLKIGLDVNNEWSTDESSGEYKHIILSKF